MAHVTVTRRFTPGTPVRLIRVEHWWSQMRGKPVADDRVLRPEGGEVVAEGVADDAGTATFTEGVLEPVPVVYATFPAAPPAMVAARYFVTGVADGEPVEVRARGESGAPGPDVSQPPVQPDRPREIRPARSAPTAQSGPTT